MFGLGYLMRSCIVCGQPFPDDDGGIANAPGMRVDAMTCWAFHPDCWEEAPSFVDFLEGAA
jgi:hypothetical protein